MVPFPTTSIKPGAWLLVGLLAWAAGAAGAPRAQIAFDPEPLPEPLRPVEWSKEPIQRPSGVDLVVTFDQQQYPAFKDLIDRFGRERGLKINVSDGTCGTSAAALAKRSADIGGFCCPNGATDRLPGLEFHTMGIAGKAFITHPTNPRDSITLEQARSLFSGRSRNWSELEPLDGPARPGPVQPIARLHCAQRPGHWRLLLDDENRFSPTIIEVGSIPDMLGVVARNPSAIGWETLWMIGAHRATSPVKVLKLGGVDPGDRRALAEGRYAVYRTYVLTTWGDAGANPHARELVDRMLAATDDLDERFAIAPVSELRKHGWKFRGGEMIGEPDGSPLSSGE